MFKSKINPGSVVVLKSGGPKMTVSFTEFDEYRRQEQIFCKWFDENNNLQRERFYLDTLRLVAEED